MTTNRIRIPKLSFAMSADQADTNTRVVINP